jgi:hypothetical protein
MSDYDQFVPKTSTAVEPQQADSKNPYSQFVPKQKEEISYKSEKETEGAIGYGLVTGLAGLPGETERFLGRTIPETLGFKMPKEKPYETVFPTVKEVQDTLSSMGLWDPRKEHPGAVSVGEFAPAVYGIGKGGYEAFQGVKNYLSSRKSATELADLLRTRLSGLTSEQAETAKTTGAQSQSELERQRTIQEQLAAREKVAGQRAVTATTTIPGQLATEANVRQVVADRVKSASAKAMRDAQAAGLNAEQTKIAADEAGRKITLAHAAIEELETTLANRPGMTKDEFGEVIRSITKKLHADAMNARANESGLGQVVANGDRVKNVSTKEINNYIDTVLRSTKDPTLRSQLSILKNELRNEVEQQAIAQVVKQSRGGVAPATRARRDWTNIVDADNPDAARIAPHVIKFQTIANEMAERLGLQITPRVNIANTRRNMFGMATHDGQIFIRSNLSEEEALTTFIHEFGHQIDYQLLRQASKETQLAIRAAWEKQFAEQKKKTVLELRPISGQKYPPKQQNLVPRGGYYHSQVEWFAEQVSRWITTDEKPTTVVEKFFKNVGETWKQFYQSVTGHTPLASEVNSFMQANWTNDLLDELLTHASEPTENSEYFLTLKQAQSLKTYIDGVLNNKEFGKSAKESAVKYQFSKIKTLLLERMKEHNQDFVDALNKWRIMSRPLDIVERNGALKPVIARDPVSLEYKLSEAEVVGRVISKSNAGHIAFSRLLKEDPSIKEAARLYYVQELFGADTAPTQRTLNLFLKNNERSLSQLGLTEEFSSIVNARKAAQAALDEATEAKAAAEAVSRSATKAQVKAESKAAESKSLAKRSESRLADSLKTTTSAEDLAKQSAARARSIETKTKNTIDKLQKIVAESSETKLKYEKMVADLEAAPVTDVDVEAKKIINDLYNNKIIDIDQYKGFKKDLSEIQDKFGKSDRSKKLIQAALRKIGLYSGLGIFGSLGYFGTQAVIGE